MDLLCSPEPGAVEAGENSSSAGCRPGVHGGRAGPEHDEMVAGRALDPVSRGGESRSDRTGREVHAPALIAALDGLRLLEGWPRGLRHSAQCEEHGPGVATL